MDRALTIFSYAMTAIGLVLMLAGCTWPRLDLSLAPHLPCSAGPVLLHHGDVITDATGREIVALNETGAKLCGWMPPGGK